MLRLVEVSRSRVTESLSKTTESFSKTLNNLSKTVGKLSKAFENPSKTFGKLSKTLEKPSKTLDNLSKTLGKLSKTLGKPSKTFGNLSKTGGNPTLVKDCSLLPDFPARHTRFSRPPVVIAPPEPRSHGPSEKTLDAHPPFRDAATMLPRAPLLIPSPTFRAPRSWWVSCA